MENYEVTISQKAGSITCDFEGAKAYLNSQLSIYRGMVFTEDSKKEAKNTVAELRKQKKAFSDRVKEVKAEYMKPFDDFQKQANELIGMYDDPVNFINEQIDVFEQKRISEKKQRIEEIYEEFMSDMQDVLPLKKIYNIKWENATFTEKQIKDEMTSLKQTVKVGLETINGMGSDVEEAAINIFLQDYDLSKAILYINNHEKQKMDILAREQERIRREEEERIRREERERLEAERRHEEELRQAQIKAEEDKQKAVEQAKAEAEQEVIDSFIPDDTDGVEEVTYEYHITLSDDAKQKLEMFMDSVGIEYEIMPVF